MKEFIEELLNHGIEISIKGSDLSLKYENENLPTQDLIQSIKEKKKDLLDYLSGNRFIIPVNKSEEGYPVTSSQYRMWMLSQLDNVSSAYNISFSAKISGPLEIDALMQAFQILVNRYEILRTYFMFDQLTESVKQFVVSSEESKLDFSFLDYSLDDNKQQKIQDYIDKQHVYTFNLEKPSLFRISLIQTEEEVHLFYISMHHIISDGWSTNLMASEVFTIYFDILNNSFSNRLIPFQYKDYAVWLQEEKYGSKYKKAQDFWLGQFTTIPPVLELPSFKRRPEIKTYNGKCLQKEFSLEFFDKIRNFSLKYHTSVFTVLEAGVKSLLYRYSNQNDIVVGTPVAGREHPDLENQLGLFINTLPLRTVFEDRNTFSTIIKKETDSFLSAYQHQIYPFDELINNLNLNYDLSRSLLFDVLVVFQNQNHIKTETKNVAELSIEFEKIDKQTSQFDVTFSFKEEAEKLALTIEYNTDIYDEFLITRMFNHFESLVSLAIENENTAIEDLVFITEKEKIQLLSDFNNTKIETEKGKGKTIINLFEEQAAKTPDNVAVIFENTQLTYKAINELTNQLGHHLRSAYKIQSDDLIAIKLDRSEKVLIAILAVLKSGAAYVPIDPEYPKERIAYIQDDLKARIIIDESFLEGFTNTKENYPNTNLIQINAPESLAYIIYTSGTTGQPKGVMIENKSVVNLVLAQTEEFKFRENESVLLFSNYTFDASVEQIFLTLLNGATLHITSKSIIGDHNTLKNYLQENKITHFHAVPSILEQLDFDDNFSLKRLVSGGDICTQTLANKFKNQKFSFYNEYGPTETTVTSIELLYSEGKISIGRPIANTEVYILDQNLQLASIGSIGKLYISGTGLSRGYLNKPGLTAEKFVVNPFIENSKMYDTGDLARWLPDGTIEFLGRKDFQVKVRGYRIELGEIETHFAQFNSGIKNVIATAKDVEGNKILIAYYTTDKTEAIEKDSIRKYLLTKLPEYMVPAFFVELEHIPLNSNGKVDYNALPDVIEKDLIRTEFLLPRNDTEQKLADIWQEVLVIDKISITDNFFIIGGDSIRVLKVVNRINKHWNIMISVSDVYNNYTIEKLSALLNIARSDDYNFAGDERRNMVLDKFTKLKDEILLSDKLFEKENIEDIYPMSPIETGMVYTSLRYPDLTGVHHQSLYRREFDNFKIEVFKKALSLLITKHNVLRTEYNVKDFGSEVRIIRKQIPATISYEDISSFDKKQQTVYLEKYLSIELEIPFDLYAAPLWRMAIFKENENCYSFIWQFHHSILDGWSNASFITELNNTYSELNKNPNYIPSPLKSDYKDYIIQNDIVQNDITVQEFWRKELLDYTRLDIFDELGENIYEELTNTLEKNYQDRLRVLSTESGISIKAISLGVFSYLLWLLNYDNEVVLGLVGSNRPVADDSEQLLGCFLTATPFKINTPSSEDAKIIDFIRAVQDKMTLLKGPDQMSLPDISALVAGKESKNTTLLFNAAFNFIDFHILEDIEIDDFQDKEELENIEKGAAKAFSNSYLDIDINTGNQDFKVSLRLTRSLKGDISLAKLSSIYFSILKSFIDFPHIAMKEIKYMDLEELNVLDSFNDVKPYFDLNRDIVSLFREKVKKQEDKIAVKDSKRQLTYKELDLSSNRLSNYIMNKFVPAPDNLYGVMMDRSVTMCETILGVWKSGTAYVPIDKNYPMERILQIITNSNLKALFIDSDIDDTIADELSKIIPVINADIIIKNKDIYNEYCPVSISLSSLAYVIYTSGSTGVPKGAMLEHWGMLNHIGSKIVEMGMDENSIVAQNAPHTFDISVWQMFSALVTGGTTVIYDYNTILDIPKFCNAIQEDKIKVLELVPSYFSEMLYYLDKYSDILPLEDLDILILNAETLFPSVVNQWIKLYPNIPIVNTYGITETSDDLSHFIIKESITSETTPVGKRPIQNLEIHVVDPFLKRVPIGVTGEIIIAGQGVGRGYLNDKERTNKVFLQGPIEGLTQKKRIYRTGDLGRYSHDGTLEFLGRKDYQIKVGGHRVELLEIETKLNLIPEIKEAIVLDLKNEKKETFLAAFYTVKNKITEQELKKVLKKLLPVYMVPSVFIELEKFSLSSNGKINRNELRNWKIQTSEKKETTTKNYSPLELELLEEWKEVLGRDDIDVDDDFFDLGGDSFKAIRLVSKSKYGFSIIDFYNNTTIKTMADFIKMNKVVSDGSILIHLLKAKNEQAVSVIGVPNSGGEPINFKDLGIELGKKETEFNFYCVDLPRIDPKENETMDVAIDNLSEILYAEIKRKVKGPLILFGHCKGSVLIMKTIELLQKEDAVDLRAICISSFFPTEKVITFGNQSDEEIVKFLTRINGNIPENDSDRKTFYRNFRYDSDFAYSGLNYYLHAVRKSNFTKFGVPFYFLTGTKDPVTKGYKRKYKRWREYAQTVELIEIKGAGHFLLRDSSIELAEIFESINNKCIKDE
ncbi:hypothetical protein ASF10_21385 [Flavobacterium sp. Leaf82]|uniref:non-ribosomal peptide synthetase n=1 Tax=unclassified Flavobacterium TaxID=196869 RepID=UPI0006F2731D|nr:non-ribosomal peptide synthetase [Flavobacterium sp. Leaf82]KQO32132.1 hypothetical protein ASF10_21385 [Flavobacterium sp. Leaf82]